MQLCKYAGKQGCIYASMQVCKYASMWVWKYTSMQVYEYASIWVCKYMSMQVFKFASMQVCKYASLQVCKYTSIKECKYAIMSIFIKILIYCKIISDILWQSKSHAKTCHALPLSSVYCNFYMWCRICLFVVTTPESWHKSCWKSIFETLETAILWMKSQISHKTGYKLYEQDKLLGWLCIQWLFSYR